MEVKGGPGGARTLLPGPPARTGPALSPASGASLASHEPLPGHLDRSETEEDAIDLASEIGPGGEGLSGGQRRRLGVAQAYLRSPGLLLLDEPTEGLDRQTARALLENLRSALPGATIIAAIHDRTLDHVPMPGDAMVRLAAGRVHQVT